MPREQAVPDEVLTLLLRNPLKKQSGRRQRHKPQEQGTFDSSLPLVYPPKASQSDDPGRSALALSKEP
jgi:hypothetical protein